MRHRQPAASAPSAPPPPAYWQPPSAAEQLYYGASHPTQPYGAPMGATPVPVYSYAYQPAQPAYAPPRSPGADSGMAAPLMGTAAATTTAGSALAPARDAEEERAIEDAVAAYQLGRVRSGFRQTANYLSTGKPLTFRRKADQFMGGWGHYLALLGITLWSAHELKSADSLAAAQAVGQNALKYALTSASVFVAHKLVYAYQALAMADFAKERALHFSTVVDSYNEKARVHDDARVVYGGLGTMVDLGSVAMLAYAAFRFAVADPNHFNDNLGILAAGLSLDIGANILRYYSESRRTASMNPDAPVSKNDFSNKTVGMFFVAGALVAVAAGIALTGEPSYDRSIKAASIMSAGALLASTVFRYTSADVTAKALDQKLDAKVKFNSSTINVLGFSCLPAVKMKECNRERMEELLFKGAIAATVFATKRYASLLPVLFGVVGVSVIGKLIAENRAERQVKHHNDVHEVARTKLVGMV